jgi:hypothetical protein
LDMVAAGGEVITTARAMGSGCCRCCALTGDAPGVRGSGRVLFVGDALGVRGRNKKGAGDGERPLRAQRTQEVVKEVPGSTAGAGVGR